MTYSCGFNLRLPIELRKKLEVSVNEGKFQSISDAIRSYVQIGIHVESYKTMIKDPEFLKSIEELKKTEGIFNWIETLSEEQSDAIAMALKMEKERRTENGTYR